MISGAMSNKFVLNTRQINRDPDYKRHREMIAEGMNPDT